MKYENTLPNSEFSDTRARANRVIVASGHSNNYLRFRDWQRRFPPGTIFNPKLIYALNTLEQKESNINGEHGLIKCMMRMGAFKTTSRILPVCENGFTSCMWIEQNGFYGSLSIIYSHRITNSGYMRYVLKIKEN